MAELQWRGGDHCLGQGTERGERGMSPSFFLGAGRKEERGVVELGCVLRVWSGEVQG